MTDPPTTPEEGWSLPEERFYLEVAIAKNIELYCAGILLFAGVFGNVMSLIVLARKRMRSMTMSVYLSGVAVGDLTALVFGQLGRHWVRNLSGLDLTSLSSWYCSFWMCAVNWATCYSSFLLAGVAAERCIAISAPLKARSYITRRGAVSYTISAAVLSLVYSANSFWSFHVVQRFGARMCTINRRYYFVTHVRVWSDFLFYFAAGGAVIIVANIIIIVRVVVAKIKRGSLMTEGGSDKDRQIVATIAMLVTVSLVYVILIAPLRIAYVIGLAFPGGEVTSRHAARLTLFWAISVFCVNANHSVNFFIYVISGQQFRNELKQMFHGVCIKVKRRPTEETTKTTQISVA